MDYEGELGLVIGRRCRHVPAERAFEVVAGVTVVNDVSVRDWQWRIPDHDDGQGLRHPRTHRAVDRHDDELGDLQDLSVRTWVNGELRQDGSTADMIFTCAQMIEHLSAAFTLEPGMVISTGTPAGVAAGKDPPRWLAAGDTVTVEVGGVGRLTNPVIDEPAVDATASRRRVSPAPEPEGVVRVSSSLAVPLSELHLRFSPSGGPGGQHANKVNTRVELRFDISRSPSLGSPAAGPVARAPGSGAPVGGRRRALADSATASWPWTASVSGWPPRCTWRRPGAPPVPPVGPKSAG